MLREVLFALTALALPWHGRPMRAEAWWKGLDARRETAPARGVCALEAPHAERIRIAGGTFVMGSSLADIARAVSLCRREIMRSRCEDIAPSFRAEGSAHEVTLSPFEIDRTEVSVAAYERCVVVGACGAPGFQRGDPRFDEPELPVTNVRWDDAVAYCSWSNARLPTEAEWEFAARGTNGREFPWGNIYNPHLSNHGALANDETDSTDGYEGLAPVSAFPDGATPLGVLNLAGNVAEWVHDLFELDENGFGYTSEPQHNPRGAVHGGFHVVRGGAYTEGAAWIRGASRTPLLLPRAAWVGFRCAKDAS